MSSRLVLRVSALLIGACLLVACGSSGNPTRTVSVAARQTLAADAVVAPFTIRIDGDVYSSGLEVMSSALGWSDITFGAGEETLHVRPQALLLGGRSIFGETGGRFLLLDPRETWQDLASSELALPELASMAVRGWLRSYLEALRAPRSVSTIGRAVVEQQATTHYLVDSLVDDVPQLIEVWVSDAGRVVRLQYLATNLDGRVVEIELTLDEGTVGLLVDTDARSTVTFEALMAEREEARLAAEAARRRQRADEERARLRSEQLAREEELRGNDVQLRNETTTLLASWLRQNWWEASDERGFRVATAPAGFLCMEVLWVGLEYAVECSPELPAAETTLVCSGLEIVDRSFESDPGVLGWSTASDELLAAVRRAELDGPLVRFGHQSETGEFLVDEWSDGHAVERDASALWAWVREGYSGDSDAYSMNATLHARFAVLCDVRLDSPWVLHQVPFADSSHLPVDVLNDPLFRHLYIGHDSPEDSIRILQEALLEVGFDLSPTGVDGYYGPSTEDAVRRLQQDAGLPGWGTVDLETLAALRWRQLKN